MVVACAGCDEAKRDLAPPPPPLPDGYPQIDPLVAAKITTARSPVLADHLDAGAWLELGMVYQANWYPELAEACYRRAVTIDETRARGWFHLAAVGAEHSRLDAAIDAMNRAVLLAPGFAPAHWRLGLMQLDAGRVAEAEQSFRRATEVDLADPAGWCGLVRTYLLTRRAAEAVELITLRLKHGRYGPYARHLLARAYRQLGRFDEARAELSRAATTALPWRDAWSDDVITYRTGLQPAHQAAMILIRAGRHGQAAARLEPLLEHWPDETDLKNTLAVALAGSGNPDRAISLLNEVLARHPDHHVALTNLALAYMTRGGPGDIDEAMTRLQRSLGANPAYAETHELFGRLHFLTNRFDAGIDAFRTAVACDARRTDLLVEIGRGQIALRRWADAAVTFDDAVRRAPGLEQAWLGLGIAAMELGNLQRASAALERARATIRPDNPAWGVLQSRLATLEWLQGTTR